MKGEILTLILWLTSFVPSFRLPIADALVAPTEMPWLPSASCSRQTEQMFLSHPETTLRETPAVAKEWDVNRYQAHHGYVWGYGASLIDFLQHTIGNGEDEELYDEPLRILDVGCGSGELTAKLAQTFPSFLVHGMDADSNMLQTAQSQFPNLRFFQQDIRTLKVDEKYDVVFSNAALHWIPPHDVERAIQALAGALRPGGQLVVEFGGKGNVQSIIQATHSALRESGITGMQPFPSWYFPSIGEFAILLEKHGIHVTSAELYDRPTPLEEGEEGLSGWLRMFAFQFLFEELSPKEVDLILTKIENSLRPSHLWNGKRWIADYRRIRVAGVKTGKTNTHEGEFGRMKNT